MRTHGDSSCFSVTYSSYLPHKFHGIRAGETGWLGYKTGIARNEKSGDGCSGGSLKCYWVLIKSPFPLPCKELYPRREKTRTPLRYSRAFIGWNPEYVGLGTQCTKNRACTLKRQKFGLFFDQCSFETST